MPEEPKVTPERLREIIDEQGKLKTFAEWVDYTKALTPEEQEAIEAYTQKLPGAVQPAPKPPVTPTVKPTLVIERIPYPKWWRDSLNAKIDFSAPGSKILAMVHGNLRLFVATIVITVTGATKITITFGTAGASGPIYLGDTGQPMGMVIAMGNSPAPCGNGSLSISATDPNNENPSIGGFATCFAMTEKE